MLLIRILHRIIDYVFLIIYKRSFLYFGIRSRLRSPLKITGMKNIYIGNNVFVAYKTWLAALPLTGELKCELIIGDGTNIGNFNHIYATNSIIIGQNVLTADKVYITDNLHSYEDVTSPIIRQPIKQISNVIIGDGTWLGENVCVIGAKIGKNCVIGANSVVTKDIPDYSVAVGTPAIIIKRFCIKNNTWLKTDNKGEFLNRFEK
jgi:serine acetyltransferase